MTRAADTSCKTQIGHTRTRSPSASNISGNYAPKEKPWTPDDAVPYALDAIARNPKLHGSGNDDAPNTHRHQLSPPPVKGTLGSGSGLLLVLD